MRREILHLGRELAIGANEQQIVGDERVQLGDVRGELRRTHATLERDDLRVGLADKRAGKWFHYLYFTFAISSFAVKPSPKSSMSISLRISTSASPFGKNFGARFTHSIASSFDLT